MSAEEGVPPADQAAEEAASKVNGLQEKGFAAILEIMAAVIEGGASITEAQFMSIMRSPAAALVKKGTSKMVKEAGKADEEGDGPCKVTPFVTALGESVNRLMDEQYAIASNSFTKRVFKAMDKDGGGTIGQSELDEVIQVMQSLGSDPALAGATLGLFTRFLDEDGNGVLEADDVVRLTIAFIQMVMSQVSRFMGIAVDAFTADSVSAPFGACIAEAMANEENPLASKLPVAIDELVTKLITTEEGGEAIADGLIAELMQLMEGEVPQFALGQFLAPVLASGEATFSVVDFIDAFNQQMSPIMDMVVGMAEDMIGAMVPQMVGELAGGLPVPLFDAELLGTGAAKFATDLIKTLPKIVKLEMTGPLEAIFDLIDIDGSGEVDAEEIKKFLNVMNPKEEGSEGDKKKYLSDLLGIIDVSNTGSLSEQDIVQFLHKFVRIGQAFANAGLHTVSRVASVPNFKKLTAVFASAVLELPEEAMEQLSPMGIKQPKEYLTTGIKICELEAVLNNVLGAMGGA